MRVNKHPLIKKTQTTEHNSYYEKANELIAKLTESRNVNIPVYWQDNAQKPMDELQHIELQIYASWSL